MDQLVLQSDATIDGPHTAISSWSKSAPNTNLFQTIIGMSYPDTTAPNGAAVIVAAPLGGGKCGGVSIQIYPSGRSCSVIQRQLLKQGRTIATLQKLPVVQTKDGARNVLLPTTGGGCTVVSVRQQ